MAMLRVVACLALLAVASAVPANILADTDVHKLARAVKSSTEMATTTKKTVLAKLKTMDQEIKRLPAMHGKAHDKLVDDIKSQLSSVKSAMGVMAKHTATAHKALAAHKATTTAHRSLEESKTKVSRVNKDVQELEAALHSAHMTHDMEHQMEQNLEAIKKDANRLATASATQKPRLHEAIGLRIKALRMALGEDVHASSESDSMAHFRNQKNILPKATHTTKTPGVKSDSAVKKDVTQLEEAVRAGSFADRKDIISNLEAIKTDAHKLTTASKTQKSTLAKAIRLRMDALKQQLEETHSTHSTHSVTPKAHTVTAAKPNQAAAKKVDADVAAAEKAVSSSHMTAHMKAETRKNLEAIKTDADKLAASHTKQTTDNLKKAIHLRMQALHKQLEEYDEDNVEAADEGEDGQEDGYDGEDAADQDEPSVFKRVGHAMGLFEEQAHHNTIAHHNTVQHHDTTKLKAHLENIKSEIASSSDLSFSTKREAKNDIRDMEADLVKLKTAGKAQASKLGKAIQLRMKALKEMLH